MRGVWPSEDLAAFTSTSACLRRALTTSSCPIEAARKSGVRPNRSRWLTSSSGQSRMQRSSAAAPALPASAAERSSVLESPHRGAAESTQSSPTPASNSGPNSKVGNRHCVQAPKMFLHLMRYCSLTRRTPICRGHQCGRRRRQPRWSTMASRPHHRRPSCSCAPGSSSRPSMARTLGSSCLRASSSRQLPRRLLLTSSCRTLSPRRAPRASLLSLLALPWWTPRRRPGSRTQGTWRRRRGSPSSIVKVF